MADIADVEQAIADTATSILYPMGSSQSSIIGVACRVYRGWPNAAALNADLNVGAVNITVDTDNESGCTTTRYLPKWQGTSVLPGIEVSTNGQTILISGNPVVGDVVGALVDGKTYSYRIQGGDTPPLIASNLNQLIQTTQVATVRGSSITVPGAVAIKVRAVCDGICSFESRRQEKDLRITCWCPSPPVRDAVSGAIDAAIDGLDFLVLPDESKARITYRNTNSYDQSQNALLYRRDLVYTVEYPTMKVVRQPSLLFGASDLNTNVTYG